jgi:CubicO group peptidase (beta-lactamase class C family)
MNVPISSSHWIVPYTPNKTPDLFLRKEIEKSIDKIFKNSMQLSLANNRLYADTIPPSKVSLTLRCALNSLTKLHREGLLNGEVVVARGSDVIFNIQSNDVQEIAKGTNRDAQFLIGSVSKQFFAVALLRVLYANVTGTTEAEKTAKVIKLLHVPLSSFFPKDSPLWASKMPEWADTITLHHLAAHTSGLFDFGNECEEFGAIIKSGKRLCDIPQKDSIKSVLKIIDNKPLHFNPGTKFSYSNTGYSLIGEVIASLSGMPLSLYMKKTLFDTIGLTSTYNAETGTPDSLKKTHSAQLVLPLAYDPTKDQRVLKKSSHSSEDMSWVQGAGSIISTAQDLLKWNLALHRERSLLPSALYQRFIQPNLHHYAYGIGSHAFYGGAWLEHNGHLGNYQTDVLYLPEHNISVISMSNTDIESPQKEQECEKLMEKLKTTIVDNGERQREVHKIMDARYPDLRQAALEEILSSFFTGTNSK